MEFTTRGHTKIGLSIVMRVATESWQDLGIKVQSTLEFTTRGHTKIGLSIVMRVATESWQDLGIKVQSISKFTALLSFNVDASAFCLFGLTLFGR